MKKHIVIDGNAFYEVDEACMKRLEAQKRKQQPPKEPKRRSK